MFATHNEVVIKSQDVQFSYLMNTKYKKMKLTNSSVNGVGIIASETINKGEIICPLLGLYYDMRTSQYNYPKYSYQVSDHFAIEPINESGFFNHTREGNCFLNKQWLFEATQTITIGEEITMNYGISDYADYQFITHKPSPVFGNIFHGKMCENKQFQKMYGAIFSPYLKKKFAID